MAIALQTSQRQEQTLAPQLQQGVRLLAMGLPQLRAEIVNAMAGNPLIEYLEPTLERQTMSDCEHASDERSRRDEGDYPEDSELDTFRELYRGDEDALDRRRLFLENRATEETLEAHLLRELQLSDVAPCDYPLAETLIGELDGNGWFVGSIPDVMMVSGESEAHVREVLAKIGELDPPGCGATTLRECLLPQLDKLPPSPTRRVVAALVDRYLEELAAGENDKILRELKVNRTQLDEAVTALRTLDARPGRNFARADRGDGYIHPEIHAVLRNGRWLAAVDDRSLPEITISNSYRKMLDDRSVDKSARDYLARQLAEAQMLIDAVGNRRATITRVAQDIFDTQPGFFTDGFRGLVPMTQEDVAKRLNLDPSTVSRAVNDKYASTPRGTVELRKFFTQAFVTKDGTAISKFAIDDKLKELVDGEDKAHPFGDGELAERLKAAGFPVARRTVAKYRGRLGIPSVSERKPR